MFKIKIDEIITFELNLFITRPSTPSMNHILQFQSYQWIISSVDVAKRFPVSISIVNKFKKYNSTGFNFYFQKFTSVLISEAFNKDINTNYN